MREHLYRAKQRQTDLWIFGDLTHNNLGNVFINNPSDGLDRLVYPETVGQYTGLQANGVKVFEGDIIRYTWDNPENPYDPNIEIHPVFWENGCFYIGDESIEILLDDPEGYEIIDNIHDNPELLEVK